MGDRGETLPLRALAGTVLVIACLYWARGLLIPLALAILLTFLLAPLVGLLRRVGLPRFPAALLVVLFAVLVALGIGWGLFRQVSRLADELPQYRSNIDRKIGDLRQARRETLSNVERAAKELLDQLQRLSPAGEQPVPVVVDHAGFLGQVRVRAFETLGSGVLVILLLLFMLARQQELRNRIILLFGHRRLSETTHALDNASARVTRYLLTHSAVNVAFGVAVSVGLFLVGVPYALVWGGLGVVLRFVPYAGVWVAMGLPVLMSLAAFDGWLSPLVVIALFTVIEITMVFAVEPLAYGKSVGVSDVALIVAVAFWIWLWGPIGLVLATPLTVCALVFARHIPALDFLTVLLTDEPLMEPAVVYYQRLLARDRAEAAELVQDRLEAGGVAQLADTVLIPALVHAQRDLDAGRLDEEEHAFVVGATAKIVDELVAGPGAGEASEAGVAARPARMAVLGYPARDHADELVLRLLRHALDRTRHELQIVSPERADAAARLATLPGPAVLCVSALPPGGAAHARHVCRRVRAAAPEIRIVVGRWVEDSADRDELVGAGAHQVVGSLREMIGLLDGMAADAVAPAPGTPLIAAGGVR